MELKNVDKLLKIIERRKELETVISEEKKVFEEKIILPKATLEDLIEQEDQLREEVLLELEKEEVNTLNHKDRVITYNIRRTRQIEDVDKLFDSLYAHKDKIEKDLGYELNTIYNTAFKTARVIINKPYLEEVISNYEKVEGENLEGINIKETKFLTVK